MKNSIFSSFWVKSALVAVPLVASSTAALAFDLTLNITGLNAAQQTAFNQAEALWESVITGYQAGISLTGITINGSVGAIDGAGGILGSAGPSTITNQGGFWLTRTGTMNFDSADLGSLSSDQLFGLFAHEMGHVLGIGTLWGLNEVYADGTGEYTGAFGLAAYQDEFSQAGATFVPVELGGGAGTADGHWDEVNGGAGLTGITDSLGRDMRDELMTGWLNSPTFLSQLTIQSLRDIGFTVADSSAKVPEPSSLLGIGLLVGLGAMSRKRQKREE